MNCYSNHQVDLRVVLHFIRRGYRIIVLTELGSDIMAETKSKISYAHRLFMDCLEAKASGADQKTEQGKKTVNKWEAYASRYHRLAEIVASRRVRVLYLDPMESDADLAFIHKRHQMDIDENGDVVGMM